MKKTTAKVRYRKYVPYGWIAIKFCNVDFYGFYAEKMEEKWRKIKLARYDEYDSIYRENETKINNMRSEAEELLKKARESKPLYRFWNNKVEKEMISEANKLLNQAEELEEKNKEIGYKRFFDVYECHRKIESLLVENGFILTSTSSLGEECVTTTEIWMLEEE